MNHLELLDTRAKRPSLLLRTAHRAQGRQQGHRSCKWMQAKRSAHPHILHHGAFTCVMAYGGRASVRTTASLVLLTACCSVVNCDLCGRFEPDSFCDRFVFEGDLQLLLDEEEDCSSAIVSSSLTSFGQPTGR
eukprot:scaffold44324_cov30-Tisochrysis_lutea.AAC.4